MTAPMSPSTPDESRVFTVGNDGQVVINVYCCGGGDTHPPADINQNPSPAAPATASPAAPVYSASRQDYTEWFRGLGTVLGTLAALALAAVLISGLLWFAHAMWPFGGDDEPVSEPEPIAAIVEEDSPEPEPTPEVPRDECDAVIDVDADVTWLAGCGPEAKRILDVLASSTPEVVVPDFVVEIPDVIVLELGCQPLVDIDIEIDGGMPLVSSSQGPRFTC